MRPFSAAAWRTDAIANTEISPTRNGSGESIYAKNKFRIHQQQASALMSATRAFEA
jgi:hypothetical protein